MPESPSTSTTVTAELETVQPGDGSDDLGDDAGGDDFEELPGRPLRKRFGPLTFLLLGLIIACGAFYGGATYGKSQGTSGSTGRLASALASSALASTGGKFPSRGSFPSRVSKSSSSGSPGTFSLVGSGVSGTIKLITGKDFYVEESTGTIVRVNTGTGTTVTVSSSGSVAQLHPGDTVTVLGANKSGTVTATRITDSSSATTSSSSG